MKDIVYSYTVELWSKIQLSRKKLLIRVKNPERKLMKKMKKFLALAMATAMVLSTAVTAFAQKNFTGADAPAASVAEPEITGVAPETTAMTAYSVITASDNGKGVVTYTLEDWAAAALAGKKFKVGGTDYTLVTDNGSGKNPRYTVDMEHLLIGLGGGFGTAGTDASLGQKDQNNTVSKTQTNEILTAIATGDSSTATVKKSANGLTATTSTPAQAEQTAKWSQSGTNGDVRLPVGYYLVKATDEENVYNPMAIAVGLEAKDLIPSSDPAAYTGKFTDVIAENSVGKYSKVPFDKEQKPLDGETMIQDKTGNDKAVGDEVKYELTTTIPNFDLEAFAKKTSGDQFPTFTIKDTLDAGLTPPTGVDKVTVKIQNTDGTDYETVTSADVVDISGQVITIALGEKIQDNSDWLNKKVLVSYSATVNASAVVGFVGNKNEAYLTYSKSTTETKDTAHKKTYDYTFAIDGRILGNVCNKGWEIKKTGEGEYKKIDKDVIYSEKKALDGAQFTLYKATTDTSAVKLKYNDTDVYGEVVPAIKLVTGGTNPYTTKDGDGRITFEGLDGRTVYYLAETKAPDGYSLNTQVYSIEFTPTCNTDGIMTSYTVKINGSVVAKYDYDGSKKGAAQLTYDGGCKPLDDDGNEDVGTTEIKNTKLASLPSTGGIGTTIFTVAGCLIMILAAGMFFATKRKEEK